MRTKPVILSATVGGKKKQIIIQKVYELSTIYQVGVDNNLEAQVLWTPRRTWEVVPHTKSRLTDDECDLILQAVLNAEALNA